MFETQILVPDCLHLSPGLTTSEMCDLNKYLDFILPQSPHLYNGNNDSAFFPGMMAWN